MDKFKDVPEGLDNIHHRNPSAKYPRKPHVFKQNLKALSVKKEVTGARLAREAGVPSRWLARISRQGLKAVDWRTAAFLRKLAAYFGLPDHEEFWNPALPEEIEVTLPDAVKRVARLHRSKPLWAMVEKLPEQDIALLEKAARLLLQHGYFRELLANLPE